MFPDRPWAESMFDRFARRPISSNVVPQPGIFDTLGGCKLHFLPPHPPRKCKLHIGVPLPEKPWLRGWGLHICIYVYIYTYIISYVIIYYLILNYILLYYEILQFMNLNYFY